MPFIEIPVHVYLLRFRVGYCCRRASDPRLSKQELAFKAGGTSQARFSQLELQPGRFTVKRLLLVLAALDLQLVVRPRQNCIEPAEW